jgi:leucyl-tRNA synthetase
MDYGTGAIFGCPAHDQRDLDFARKYDLPVVAGGAAARRRCRRPSPWATSPIPMPARIFNSGFLDGLSIDEAKKAAAAHFRRPHRSAASRRAR